MNGCEHCGHYWNNGKGDESCDIRGWDFVEENCPDYNEKRYAISIEPYTELKPIETERPKVRINFYDVVETYPNCTVQILRNSITGEKSTGWWRNDDRRISEAVETETE